MRHSEDLLLTSLNEGIEIINLKILLGWAFLKLDKKYGGELIDQEIIDTIQILIESNRVKATELYLEAIQATNSIPRVQQNLKTKHWWSLFLR